MVRLLGEASRHGNDPELFAGLVHACRYCGLNEYSLAAHAEARRLDPNIFTSLDQTLLMLGDIDRLTTSPRGVDAGADDAIRVIGLGLAGRLDEARRGLLEMREGRTRIPTFQLWTGHLLAWIERRAADMVVGLSTLSALKIQDDPEAIFQEGWLLCDVGEHEHGLAHLRRAVDKGDLVAPTLSVARAFDGLLADPRFQALLAQAEAGRQRALATLLGARGDRLLGR